MCTFTTDFTNSSLQGANIMINIREAKPSDYDAVLAIVPDHLNNSDYMPATYHHYFSDPNAHPFVAEVNGKVVSDILCTS